MDVVPSDFKDINSPNFRVVFDQQPRCHFIVVFKQTSEHRSLSSYADFPSFLKQELADIAHQVAFRMQNYPVFFALHAGSWRTVDAFHAHVIVGEKEYIEAANKDMYLKGDFENDFHSWRERRMKKVLRWQRTTRKPENLRVRSLLKGSLDDCGIVVDFSPSKSSLVFEVAKKEDALEVVVDRIVDYLKLNELPDYQLFVEIFGGDSSVVHHQRVHVLLPEDVIYYLNPKRDEWIEAFKNAPLEFDDLRIR